MIPLIGEDNIMWGSDYPHPDGIWPDSHKCFAEDIGLVTRRCGASCFATTPAKLYGLL
jgi:predicted TIM-barrel fold metal-dependent hydrolase